MNEAQTNVGHFLIHDVERAQYVSEAYRRNSGIAELDTKTGTIEWTKDVLKALVLPREAMHDVRSMVINASDERGGRPDQFVRILPFEEVRGAQEQVTLYHRGNRCWYLSHHINGNDTTVTWVHSPSRAVLISKDLANFIRSRGYESVVVIQTKEELATMIGGAVNLAPPVPATAKVAPSRFQISLPHGFVPQVEISEFERAQTQRMIETAFDSPRLVTASGIVGFAGPEGVGKDTAARLLSVYLCCQGTYLTTMHDSFAAPLYEAVSVLTGIPIEVLKDRRYKDVPITWPGAPAGLEAWTPRKLLKWMGTEVIRDQVNQNFWVDRFKERSRALLAQTEHDKDRIIVMSDVRFPNEAEACDLIIELVRDGKEYSDDHVAARGIPRECIDETIHVNAETDYGMLCGRIVMLLAAMKKAEKPREMTA